ncbi:hypothetical protein KCP71_17630 [Salmonella enterica subsp. enterica]|nr:hypothetical protein KCP71_17630 [Salmonella enterica subsp. enterica]
MRRAWMPTYTILDTRIWRALTLARLGQRYQRPVKNRYIAPRRSPGSRR